MEEAPNDKIPTNENSFEANLEHPKDLNSLPQDLVAKIDGENVVENEELIGAKEDTKSEINPDKDKELPVVSVQNSNKHNKWTSFQKASFTLALIGCGIALYALFQREKGMKVSKDNSGILTNVDSTTSDTNEDTKNIKEMVEDLKSVATKDTKIIYLNQDPTPPKGKEIDMLETEDDLQRTKAIVSSQIENLPKKDEKVVKVTRSVRFKFKNFPPNAQIEKEVIINGVRYKVSKTGVVDYSTELFPQEELGIKLYFDYSSEYKPVEAQYTLLGNKLKEEFEIELERVKLTYSFSRQNDKYKVRLIEEMNMYWQVDNAGFKLFDKSKCYNQINQNCSTIERLFTFEGAKEICDSLRPGKWRLPTIEEIKNLKDKSINFHMSGIIENGKSNNNGKAAYYWLNSEIDNTRIAIIRKNKINKAIPEGFSTDTYASCKCVRNYDDIFHPK